MGFRAKMAVLGRGLALHKKGSMTVTVRGMLVSVGFGKWGRNNILWKFCSIICIVFAFQRKK